MTEIPCEVYSRVVGYLRPVQDWNKAKQQEFDDRVTYNWEGMMGEAKTRSIETTVDSVAGTLTEEVSQLRSEVTRLYNVVMNESCPPWGGDVDSDEAGLAERLLTDTRTLHEIGIVLAEIVRRVETVSQLLG